jgi:hypothetical protein
MRLSSLPIPHIYFDRTSLGRVVRNQQNGGSQDRVLILFLVAEGRALIPWRALERACNGGDAFCY